MVREGPCDFVRHRLLIHMVKLVLLHKAESIYEDEPDVVPSTKKLDGGPLEAFVDNKPPEEHDYKGEFYPVDRHLPKKK